MLILLYQVKNKKKQGRQNGNKRILKFSLEKLAFCPFYKVPIQV